LSSPADEQILAQEQAVVNRPVGIKGELEAAVDVSGPETEGTLVLTNSRLLYVHGGEKEEDLPVGALTKKQTYFSDVDSLGDIPYDAANLTIYLSAITKVLGRHSPGMSPKLEVSWNAGGIARTTEFVQELTGSSRKKNLNDWAPVIERLRTGKESVKEMPQAPDESTLEGKILLALGDMQEKGLLTIESELEVKYKVDLETDDVESACEKLVLQGLIKDTSGKDEPPFYQKVSALGEDSLDA
jgi:hypothetical protein